MPCVTSLDALHRAVAEFAVTGPGLVIDLGGLNTVSANGSTGLVTAAGGARIPNSGSNEIRTSF